MTQQQYPELDKLNAAHGERMAIQNFLEYLEERRIILAEYHLEQLIDYAYTVDSLIFDFLEIDPAKVEIEREHLLNSLQSK